MKRMNKYLDLARELKKKRKRNREKIVEYK